MTSRIRELLARLYPAEQAEPAYAALLKRMDAAREHVQRVEDRDLFSERDVVLITYGDSVRQPGERPLQTLHRFANERLKGVIPTIHILPFFPYSSDDGFSVQDFYQVNPELGTWQDVQAVGEDFTLMFDAVFNHMSVQSEWFRAFLAGDPAYAGLFRTEAPETDLSMVMRPRVSPLLTPFQRPNGETIHVWTTFSDDQVDFDARYPATLLRLVDVLLYYIERGAAIVRLDAIAFLWKEAGTPSVHLEQTHLIIQLMRAVLDAVAPQVILITETNVPHKENISYWGDGHNEAQMVYNFTLPPLLFHTMVAGDAARLREWVNSLDTPSDRVTFFNFTASHDGIGVRPVEGILTPEELQALIEHVHRRGGLVSYRANADGSKSAYELNITYVDAVTDPAEPLELQVKQFVLTQGVALALAGTPAIYIHSLVGSHDNLEGVRETGRNRTINRAKLAYPELDAELNDPQSFRSQVYRALTELIRQRVSQPAFHPNAHQEALDLGSPAVFALLRGAGAERILAVYNLSGQPQTVPLPFAGHDLLSGQDVRGAATLAAYQMLWIRAGAPV